MTDLIWWTTLLMEAGSLVFARPGPVPSEYLTLRQAILEESRSAASGRGAADEAKENDAWAIVDRLESMIDGVNTEVRQRFRRGREGDSDGLAFSPEVLIGRPGPDAELLERDAALLGMSLLEARGFFDRMDALAASAPGVCLEASDRNEGLACRRAPAIRRIARTLAARQELAATAADAPRYLRCVEHQLALARINAFQVGGPAPIVRPSPMAQLLRQVAADLMLDRIPREHIPELAAIVERQARTPSSRLWMTADASALRTFIASTHTLNPGGDGRLVITSLQRAALSSGAFRSLIHEPEASLGVLDWDIQSPLINVFGLSYATRRQAVDRAGEFNQRLLGLAFLPYQEQRAGAAMLQDWAHELPAREFIVRVWALTTADNAEALFRHDADVRMIINGTRLMLAVEAFRAARQRLPEGLSDLVPEFIRDLPVDPYGQEGFVYRVTDAAATAPGAGYALYSVWEDGKNDQGVRSASRTQVFAPPRQRLGVDFMLNDLKDAQTTR